MSGKGRGNVRHNRNRRHSTNALFKRLGLVDCVNENERVAFAHPEQPNNFRVLHLPTGSCRPKFPFRERYADVLPLVAKNVVILLTGSVEDFLSRDDETTLRL